MFGALACTALCSVRRCWLRLLWYWDRRASSCRACKGNVFEQLPWYAEVVTHALNVPGCPAMQRCHLMTSEPQLQSCCIDRDLADPRPLPANSRAFSDLARLDTISDEQPKRLTQRDRFEKICWLCRFRLDCGFHRKISFLITMLTRTTILNSTWLLPYSKASVEIDLDSAWAAMEYKTAVANV